MRILRLLSEEVFDFSKEEMTSDRVRTLKALSTPMDKAELAAPSSRHGTPYWAHQLITIV